MRIPSGHMRLSVPAFLLVAALPSAAVAAPSVTLTGVTELEGTHSFDELVVASGAIVRVPRKAGGNKLVLVVNRLEVQSGGAVDASAAGGQGIDGGAGESPTGTVGGGGQAAGSPASPGGGGANAANGHHGWAAGCGLGAPGGVAIDPGGAFRFPGGAGGAFLPPGFTFDDMPPTRGGAGGGVVEIFAGMVIVNGAIRANGEDGLGSNFFTFSPTTSSGGGAGGSIVIHAGSLTGTGTLEVRGGDGSGDAPGGGGSGGVLFLEVADPLTITTISVVAAGLPGACVEGGHDGLVISPALTGCPDKDGDGVGGVGCPDGTGMDCDDADPSIHPGMVDERCDGMDNDCDGTVDQNLDIPCPDGSSCVMGACTPDMTPPPPVPPPTPAHVDFVGACGVVPAGSEAPGTPRGEIAAALVAFAAVLRRRRQAGAG